MKKVITILSGISLLVIGYGARQLYLLYNAKIGVKMAIINMFTSQKVDMTIYAELDNKGDISAIVKGQHYEVFLNNALVSTINANQLIHINSNGKTTLPISIIFNPSSVATIGLNNLLNLLLDKTKINIEIRGYLSMEMGIIKLKNFPIDIKYTLQELIDSAKKAKEEEAKEKAAAELLIKNTK